MESNKPTVEELADKEAARLEDLARARHKNILTLKEKVRAHLLKNEETMMDIDPNNLSFEILRTKYYAEAEKNMKIYQWLEGIEYNRYVLPVEQLKAQAAQKQAAEQMQKIKRETEQGRILTSV